MFRGFYTAATGMFAQQRRTELLTNNMSNANTPGYKSDQSSIRAFPEMLLQEFGKQNVPGQNGLKTPSASFVGAINTGAYLQETMPAFAQGALEETGNTTDTGDGAKPGACSGTTTGRFSGCGGSRICP